MYSLYAHICTYIHNILLFKVRQIFAFGAHFKTNNELARLLIVLKRSFDPLAKVQILRLSGNNAQLGVFRLYVQFLLNFNAFE